VVADVRELLLADDVHVGVVGAVVLADDHALVDVGRPAEEELAARLEVKSAYGVVTPAAVGDDRAVGRRIIAPAHGSQPSKSVLSRPVPRVAVRNSPRKPMRPREGTSELHARAAEAGVRHLAHAAAALAEALG
jgi:hypothetical protein